MATMRLPVPLTDEEKMGLAEEISAAQTALEDVEEEKRESNSSFNAKIKGHKTRIHDLNESFKTGSMEREVEVEERPNYTDCLVETVRLDTQTVISTRTMDPEQRQMGLELSNLPQPTADVEDEQRDAETPEEAEEIREARLADEQAERARIDEIAALAADQAADQKKTEKALLKVPTKGPKPKKRMSIKAPDGEELNPEPPAEPPPAPPKTDDDEGLAF